MVKIIKFYKIKWDKDRGDKSKLRKTIILPINVPDDLPDDELDDFLSDELSDRCGYCHGGFLYDDITDKFKLLRKSKEVVASMLPKDVTCYADLFISVRQRYAAYKYYRRFWKKRPYRKAPEEEYLDEAYRFLNTSIDPQFLVYCAHKEKENVIDYVSSLIGVFE